MLPVCGRTLVRRLLVVEDPFGLMSRFESVEMVPTRTRWIWDVGGVSQAMFDRVGRNLAGVRNSCFFGHRRRRDV